MCVCAFHKDRKGWVDGCNMVGVSGGGRESYFRGEVGVTGGGRTRMMKKIKDNIGAIHDHL